MTVKVEQTTKISRIKVNGEGERKKCDGKNVSMLLVVGDYVVVYRREIFAINKIWFIIFTKYLRFGKIRNKNVYRNLSEIPLLLLLPSWVLVAIDIRYFTGDKTIPDESKQVR